MRARVQIRLACQRQEGRRETGDLQAQLLRPAAERHQF